MATIDYELLHQILCTKVEYYADVLNPTDIYVEYMDKKKIRHFTTPSDKHFISYIGHCYRRRTKQYEVNPPTSDAVKVPIQEAILDGSNRVSICHRLCGSITTGSIAYDLADTEHQVVYVEPDSWRIDASPSGDDAYRFIRNSSDRPQVCPSQEDGDLFELLREFVNLDDDNFKLFVVMLIQFFSHDTDHFGFILSGPKGNGKTTLCNLIRSIVEPRSNALSVLPQGLENLKTALSNTYLAVFDNTEVLSENFSDTFCAAITGVMDSKRKLYTDNEEIVRELHNVICINGIDIIPPKPDLADRCLLFEPLPLSAKNRITDKEFADRFKEKQPEILGEIFSTLEVAMQIFPTLPDYDFKRMAGAHKEMIAIALALGMTADEFNLILTANTNHLKQETEKRAVSSSDEIFVDYLVQYTNQQRQRIKGSAQEVYEKIRTTLQSPPDFPVSASVFSKLINKNISEIISSGIWVNRYYSNNCNMLELFRIPSSQQNKEQKQNTDARKVPSRSQIVDLLSDEDDEDDEDAETSDITED